MRTIVDELDMVIKQFGKTLEHLEKHSSRKDLVSTGKQALTKLRQIKEELICKEACLSSQVAQTRRMAQVCQNHLMNLYLYVHAQGVSPMKFLDVLAMPTEMLVTPFIASMKCEQEKDLKLPLRSMSPRNFLKQLEAIEQTNDSVEREAYRNLELIKRQIEQIISKSSQL